MKELKKQITVTFETDLFSDGEVFKFIDAMLKAVDESEDCSLMQIRVQREEGSACGTYFRCQGAARNVRPMIAAVLSEKSGAPKTARSVA